MADPEEREQSIQKQLNDLETQLNVKIIERERVIPQVLNLVEWPYLTSATFQPEFFKSPQRGVHFRNGGTPKIFSCHQSDGSLKNHFIITANVPPTDQIRQGNQRVISARLSDGVFFTKKILKMPLGRFQ